NKVGSRFGNAAEMLTRSHLRLARQKLGPRLGHSVVPHKGSVLKRSTSAGSLESQSDGVRLRANWRVWVPMRSGSVHTPGARLPRATSSVVSTILLAVAGSPMSPSSRATWLEAATSWDSVIFRAVATTLKPR